MVKTRFSCAAGPGGEPDTFSKSVCRFENLVVVVFCSFLLQRGKVSPPLFSALLLGSREGEGLSATGGIIFT